MGKEAAALHMGASLGDLVARPLKLRPLTGVWKGGSRADGAGGTSGGDGAVGSASASGGAGNGGGASGGVHAYAASCGMAACFAALFFAPLGSTAFVVELSRYDRSVWRHAPFMLLACFVAFGLASIIGVGDVIPKVPLPALSWPVVGQCVVIAVACALVGTVYIQIIDGASASPSASRRTTICGRPWAACSWRCWSRCSIGGGSRARAPTCSPTLWPAAPAGGPSP